MTATLTRTETRHANKNIQALREYLGYTQQEFADKIGVTQSCISNIEVGYRNVGTSLTQAVCAVYTITPVELNAIEFNPELHYVSRN